ncbi:hypothetical protein IKF30_01685 [Candidatus Saccharibacteria bacterium]|nr:hypothetical protein [Candidatus Saccharibacteria bacterium]
MACGGKAKPEMTNHQAKQTTRKGVSMKRFEFYVAFLIWILVSLLLVSEIVMLEFTMPTFLLSVGWALLSPFTFIVLNSFEEDESAHNH